MRISALLWLALALPLLADEPRKLPIPDEAAQREASKLVAEAYKADYDAAKTPDRKVALAKKLLDEGLLTKDDSGKFVMLRTAKEMAVQQGDLETAYRAVGELAASYEVDELQLKLDAAASAARLMRTPPANAAALPHVVSLIDKGITSDRYEFASAAANVARAIAKQARDTDQVKRLTTRIKEIEEAEATFEKVRVAIKTLETNPADPEANSIVGWFQCSVKGNWEEGLPMLSLGTDDALKRVAVEELAESPDSLKIADDWWEIAEKNDGTAKERIQAHAADWYRKSLPTAAGLLKARIESRLAGLPAARAEVVEEAGKLDDTQKAALQWLTSHQLPDGSWSFDHRLACGGKCGNGGSMVDARAAATAMALLAFYQAGQTHRDGEYRETINKGLKSLMSQPRVLKGQAAYNSGSSNMYGHGLATLALCTAYARSKDSKLKSIAQASLAFTVAAQDPKGGGWRYAPGQAGDTSVTGWQICSLKLGQDAGLRVPEATFQGASLFLDSTASDGGAKYGYTGPGAGPATTASGLLARLHLGWKKDNPALQRGLEYLSDTGPSNGNIYFNYYATQAMQHAEKDKRKKWNDKMRESLKKLQATAGHEVGSWFVSGGDHGAQTAGRLYATSLSTMIYCEARD